MNLRKRDKINSNGNKSFLSGSGKFFLLVIGMYLFGFLLYKLAQFGNRQGSEYTLGDLQIEGNKIVQTQTIQKICGFASKQSTIKVIDENKIANKLRKIDFVKGVSVTRRLPRTINITIVERDPVAFIYGKGLNMIDEDGVLLPVNGSETIWDLPIISGIKESLGALGDTSVSRNATDAIDLVVYMKKENPLLAGMISEINMHSPKYIELYLIRGGASVRIPRKEYHKPLYVLKNYLVNYIDWKILKQIDYIDLRFENQLIVKEKA